MSSTVFNKEIIDHTKQYMFFGESPNVQRFDTMNTRTFYELMDRQLSLFWRPTEVDLSKDTIEFQQLSDHAKHVFTQNLFVQSLLDSIQGRGPNLVLLPHVSDVTLENFITAWTMTEGNLHSDSYTHIVRAVYTDPTVVFDGVMLTPQIMKRAESITKYYDDVIKESDMLTAMRIMNMDEGLQKLQLTKLKEALYLCVHTINALEAIRFYVSFVCNFSFPEFTGMMEGSAKIMRLIARDEAVHLKATQTILHRWQSGKDDPEMVEIAKRLEPIAVKIFEDVVDQEKEWANYLFGDKALNGLTAKNLCDYIEYLSDNRMRAAGLPSSYAKRKNPLPWVTKWLNSESVQVAPQEVEVSEYLSAVVADLSKEKLASLDV
ncbi:aerobic ribonucleoside diphosphate reductase small subunit [Aeromonas phage AS-yj]|uniref:ribonucleoside-diphosphate reductase n=5 Tax=Ceceduovirus TaxID=2842588 RepID=A0A411B8H0_9CAUD|nr:aerobic NDP reductase small subunit [Aeromonas phage CC2]YP_009834319.1 aerobic NDP reductase small subunit [Aeromonas phage AS-zj]YP_009834950.1 aerobic NDP reductase small subunit [Aeromonas phage AS-sw]ATI18047.1 aerobic ribonucleoside diphosphate reductase small subunit [Aeromonas phage AS-yj]QAX97904.1 aerobic ribonucleoside diphosphate reductase small subunit [Aeromonas phage Asswx_1]QAX99045.1 aerobic ribonucleoside diphosphate reductase small subunit [Aeromonas phage Assk]QMV28767.